MEQQLYMDVDEGGLISVIDLLCSGFRPAEDPDATGPSERTHRFDAGTLGCADGLAGDLETSWRLDGGLHERSHVCANRVSIP